MEVWRILILVVSILGLSLLGYFFMVHLDKFLNENRKTIENESEKREPSCIMLTEDMSDEEIADEVKRFREKHESTRIVLLNNADTELSESTEYCTERKQ